MRASQAKLWPKEIRDAWESTEPACRFQYQMNRVLLIFLLSSPVILWVYWLATVLTVMWSWSLSTFTVTYMIFTIYLVVSMMRWRAFCVMSVVIIKSDRLIWSHDGRVNIARWTKLDLDNLGLQSISGSRNYEAHLTIKTEEGSSQKLYLYRQFCNLMDLEAFMEQTIKKLRPKGRRSKI